MLVPSRISIWRDEYMAQVRKREPDFLTRLDDIATRMAKLEEERALVLQEKRASDKTLLREFMARNRISEEDILCILDEAVAASSGSKVVKA